MFTMKAGKERNFM